MIIKCLKNCCELKVGSYQQTPMSFRSGRKKAGVFIFDPKTNRVLIVLSRNRLWGLPKGSIKSDESDIDCAIREVKEETGIEVSKDELLFYHKVTGNAVYFYMEKEFSDVYIQNNSTQDANDVNGIGWVKLECIEEMANNNLLKFNKQGKLVFQKFKNLNL